MTDQPHDARETAQLISDASEPLGLFPSVIKSGEKWSPACQEVLDKARQAISKLGEAALTLPNQGAVEELLKRLRNPSESLGTMRADLIAALTPSIEREAGSRAGIEVGQVYADIYSESEVYSTNAHERIVRAAARQEAEAHAKGRDEGLGIAAGIADMVAGQCHQQSNVETDPVEKTVCIWNASTARTIRAAILAQVGKQPIEGEGKLWLWRNFVDGRPEYWAFDNGYPCDENGDPLILGEPCGYAIVKPSVNGRPEVSDESILADIPPPLSADQERG